MACRCHTLPSDGRVAVIAGRSCTDKTTRSTRGRPKTLPRQGARDAANLGAAAFEAGPRFSGSSSSGVSVRAPADVDGTPGRWPLGSPSTNDSVHAAISSLDLHAPRVDVRCSRGRAPVPEEEDIRSIPRGETASSARLAPTGMAPVTSLRRAPCVRRARPLSFPYQRRVGLRPWPGTRRGSYPEVR